MLGQALPSLNVQYLKARPDLAGKVTLLEFWATWCPPCRKSIPHLNALHAKFKDKGLVIIGVTDEDKATVEPFLAQNPMHYTPALDAGNRLGRSFGVTGIPHAVLYNRGGVAIWEGHPMEIDEALIGKALRDATTGKSLVAEAVEQSDEQVYRGITSAQLRAILDAENYDYTVDGDGDIVVTMEGLKAFLFVEESCITYRLAVSGKADLKFVNAWNSAVRFSRSYLDSDGDPVLELELDLSGGVLRERVIDFLNTCKVSVAMWISKLKDQ